MDKLKQELIDDYENWLIEALSVDGRTMVDSLGIKQIAIENFKLKLNKLIEYVHTIKCGENPTGGL
jgi:hypothetical protein